MAWTDLTRPGRIGKKGAAPELPDFEAMSTELRSLVREAIPRVSLIHREIFTHNILNGKAHVESRAIGGATIQEVTPGEVAPANESVLGRVKITVEKILSAANTIDQLQLKQVDWKVKRSIANLHGAKFADLIDESFFIAAMKAGMSTTTAYQGLSAQQDAFGGTQLSIGAQAKVNDASSVYDALIDLVAEMKEKKRDVPGAHSGHFIVMRPKMWARLARDQRVYNKEYMTSDGTRLMSRVIEVSGIPVHESASLRAGENVTTHLLNTTGNGNFFNGDFRKVIAVITHPDSLLDAFNFEPTVMIDPPRARKNWADVQTMAAFTVGMDDASRSGVLTFD